MSFRREKYGKVNTGKKKITSGAFARQTEKQKEARQYATSILPEPGKWVPLCPEVAKKALRGVGIKIKRLSRPWEERYYPAMCATRSLVQIAWHEHPSVQQSPTRNIG